MKIQSIMKNHFKKMFIDERTETAVQIFREFPDFAYSLKNADYDEKDYQNFLLRFYKEVVIESQKFSESLNKNTIIYANENQLQLITVLYAVKFEAKFKNYYHKVFKDNQLKDDFDSKINRMLETYWIIRNISHQNFDSCFAAMMREERYT